MKIADVLRLRMEKDAWRKASGAAEIALCCEFGPTYPKFDLCHPN
jgi:hypothetical protein